MLPFYVRGVMNMLTTIVKDTRLKEKRVNSFFLIRVDTLGNMVANSYRKP